MHMSLCWKTKEPGTTPEYNFNPAQINTSQRNFVCSSISRKVLCRYRDFLYFSQSAHHFRLEVDTEFYFKLFMNSRLTQNNSQLASTVSRTDQKTTRVDAVGHLSNALTSQWCQLIRLVYFL